MGTPGRPNVPEDAPPRRPRWLLVVLALFVVMSAVGMLATGWFMLRGFVFRPPAAATGPVAAGFALVQASDCMRCHLAERKAVGPGWQAIAERHAGNPEAVALLARKIREGSVGDWGRVIMPRHPQVGEADARLMAQWVLAQRPAPAGADASSPR